jgi:phenylacetate-CoA ligase
LAVAEPIPKSVTPGISWPAVVAPDTALLLALQRQFEHSERLAANELERLQLGQLERVLAHAHAQAPFWRDRLQHAGYRADRPLTLAAFRCIPIMQRKDLQAGGESCDARIVPREHGAIGTDATSGSTAEPVRFRTTDICKVMWHAITLREHLWHGRDFKARLAAIRSVQGPGDQSSWGLPADIVFETGPAFGLRVSVPIAEQAQWLSSAIPNTSSPIRRICFCLRASASNVACTCRACAKQGPSVSVCRRTYARSASVPGT